MQVILLFIIACFVSIAIYLAAKRFKLNRKQRHFSLPKQRQTQVSQTTSTINPQLRRQLISLLAGDRTAAERLVKMVRAKYPGKAENWYWEKTIDDLKRDRR